MSSPVNSATAQSQVKNGTILNSNEISALGDIHAMFAQLQLSLTSATKNNTLESFNEIPLTCETHCITPLRKRTATRKDGNTITTKMTTNSLPKTMQMKDYFVLKWDILVLTRALEDKPAGEK
jgi:hypothetical protein